ncbi:hypothetical protein HGRIS_000864 [Hohenbuehelia grisea]|uniref:Uncharacterized protein n=1 Tax=Hohenbuehelia grisea TaxID=104357 RepID=A0ABR3IPY9_9AGAR
MRDEVKAFVRAEMAQALDVFPPEARAGVDIALSADLDPPLRTLQDELALDEGADLASQASLSRRYQLDEHDEHLLGSLSEECHRLPGAWPLGEVGSARFFID